jgi:anthranilate synthase component 1
MMKRKVYTHHLKTMADLITPVGVYSALRDQFPHSLLLESADYHDRSDSKSFICLNPIAGFEATQKNYKIQYPGAEQQEFQAKNFREVFQSFKEFMAQFKAVKTKLPFNSAGLFGYSSFEAVQYMEDIEMTNPADKMQGNPDMKYQLYEYVLVFDHFKNELYITQNSVDQKSENKDGLNRIKAMLRLHSNPGFSFQKDGEESALLEASEFMENVKKGIQHCHRGDVFQLVLSRRFHQKFKGDDFNVYRSLRSINPSPYLFYFDYGNFKIMGSSPESQLQIDNGVAYINPIAGTVLRSQNAAEDAARAEELQNNPKETAEHVMLVDLARNDLSKNSEIVNVDTYAEIQYFSHVIHMVSRVSGQLFKNVEGLDIYADTFPAGTLSGAPKYRALQIINETEKISRNFYGGALGFMGFDGSINHAIIIRSILCKNNGLSYQAGAGIVADSTPEGELQEVDNKVAALRKAIEMAETL